MALQAEWTDITPALAAEYLSHAAPNRPLRKTRVDAYARDMEAGKWQVTGVPILFNGAGELVDGRHRLNATLQSGMTINMLIIRGVSNAAVDVVDTGVARTFGDVLSMHGENRGVARVLAAMTKRSYLWTQGIYLQLGGQGNLITHEELGEYLEKHSELRERAEFATGTNQHPLGVPASIYGHCYSLFCDIDADQAYDFCVKWRDGAELAAGSPVLELRERIMSGVLAHDSRYLQSGSWSVEIKHALACQAWNAYREDRKITKLQLPRGGLSNKAYPLPK